MFRRLSATLAVALLLLLAAAPTPAQTRQGASDVVLVLPFENTSNLREYNWVGESFADSLTELLSLPGLGISVVSGDGREMAYQRVRLPATVIPSRATAIKLAREAGANLVVLGTYEITPPRDDKSLAEVHGAARVIRVNEGRLSGKVTNDGRWATHEFFFGDALVNLQTVHGKLAYQILYERDDALPFSQKVLVEHATKVPPRAFESYVKGTQTNDPEKRSAYLQNALNEYRRANAGGVYPQAAFELGHLYLERQDWRRAAEHFSLLEKKDSHYAEAAFYAALSFWRLDDPQMALDKLLTLARDVPLTSVYNNAGAVAAAAARAEKAAEKRESLMKQSLALLDSAAKSAPEDLWVRYNYAYALMLAGKHAEAAENLRPIIKQNPRDPEALFLFAKALERTGQTEAAALNDNEARRYLAYYGQAQTEWERSKTVSAIPLRLRETFNRSDYLSGIVNAPTRDTSASAQDLLGKARELYTAGRDDEALQELRRVLLVEPMNAEAYLLTGRIYQRRGEIDYAINQLKTSVFWDSKMIDAHILLGRIFLERGDRVMALSYARNAMQIDPNNQEAIALQRQVEIGAK